MNKIDNVFEFAEKFSERTQLISERSLLSSELIEYETQCGYCSKWTYKECPREVNLNGSSRGPSDDHPSCTQFVQKQWAVESSLKKKNRLIEIGKLLGDGN